MYHGTNRHEVSLTAAALPEVTRVLDANLFDRLKTVGGESGCGSTTRPKRDCLSIHQA
jgi:hypothetical protein